jgi:hypothetical protein
MERTKGEGMAVGTGRRRAFQIVSVIFGLGLGFGAFAFLSLVAAWFVGGERVPHRVHDLGWAALGGILLAGGMLLQAHAPERKVAVTQGVIVAGVALVAGSLMSGEVNLFLLVPVVTVGVLVALHPARGNLVKRGPISPALAVLAVAAAVPLSVYTVGQAAIQREGGVGLHWSEFHWATQAALGLAIPLVSLVAALRAPGWRIVAWQAGLASVLFGVSSAVFPDHASSVGTAYGAAGAALGAVFIAVAEWEARRVR